MDTSYDIPTAVDFRLCAQVKEFGFDVSGRFQSLIDDIKDSKDSADGAAEDEEVCICNSLTGPSWIILQYHSISARWCSGTS